MDVFHGIMRRMELFEGFCEGRKLLHGRHISVVREGRQAGLPRVEVLTRAKRGLTRYVRVQVRDDEPFAPLAYAVADEIEDYLSGLLHFKRCAQHDERGEGYLLFLEYRR